jgi:hypothetical protein
MRLLADVEVVPDGSPEGGLVLVGDAEGAVTNGPCSCMGILSLCATVFRGLFDRRHLRKSSGSAIRRE